MTAKLASETPSPAALLRAPFDPSVIKWRPGTKTKDGSKAMALAYVDARDVMERLDAAFGPLGWSDDYRTIEERQAIEGTISVWDEKSNGWVRKADVGYRNDPGKESSKETEEYKSAYSDAFKRAAVKWGVGRDLYDTPSFWLPIDEFGRFTSPLPQYVVGKGWTLPGSVSPAPSGVTQTAVGPRGAEKVTPVAGGAGGASGATSGHEQETPRINDGQRTKLLAKAKGHELTEPQIKAALAIVASKKSSKDLTVGEFEELLRRLDDLSFVASLKEVASVGG